MEQYLKNYTMQETKMPAYNKKDFMWSARPSMKSRLHYIQGTHAIALCIYQWFVVYTELAELAIFNWNMGGLS
jgi:hypothetical protein